MSHRRRRIFLKSRYAGVVAPVDGAQVTFGGLAVTFGGVLVTFTT